MDGLFTRHRIVRPKHKSFEWYTPKWIFDRLGVEFDLDPASPHDMESEVPAIKKYTLFDDGLSKAWFGNVWLNPPYGRDTPFWMKKMVAHNNGIALVFSRTDSEWCQLAMENCSAMLFMKGRVDFIAGLENQHKISRSGAGTLMFAFGFDNAKALSRMSDSGYFIDREVW